MSNDNYKFEEYESVGGRFTPSISLGVVSGFGISAGFTKKYDISKAIGAKLFFDREKTAVGFKFVNEKENGLIKVQFYKAGGAYINAKPFLIKFDIDQKKYAGKYIPKEVELPGQGKVFVIELKEKDSSNPVV